MNLVDSCGWLEYFADGPNARFFAPALERAAELLVPTVCIYEVHKRMLQQLGRHAAAVATGAMAKGHIVALDLKLGLRAARLSVDSGLPMADSIILATARAHGATLWTQDAHFEGIDGVRYKAKP